jgi:pimeloyl-ACP methyl ester carboxylesterase
MVEVRMRQSQVTVGGGRQLAFAEIGRAGDPCLLIFHGAPASGLHIAALEAQYVAHGLRVVAPDRPSYGGSSPQPGRSMADWPADVAALADALGIERFAVAGHSSGGAYAVACAALLGDRVVGGVVLAGSTDMRWPQAWDGYLDGRAELAIMRAADEGEALALASARFGADGGGFLGRAVRPAGARPRRAGRRTRRPGVDRDDDRGIPPGHRRLRAGPLARGPRLAVRHRPHRRPVRGPARRCGYAGPARPQSPHRRADPPAPVCVSSPATAI